MSKLVMSKLFMTKHFMSKLSMSKQGLTGKNWARQGQTTGPYWAKPVQMGPNGLKWGFKKAERGQFEPNETKEGKMRTNRAR